MSDYEGESKKMVRENEIVAGSRVSEEGTCVRTLELHAVIASLQSSELHAMTQVESVSVSVSITPCLCVTLSDCE